jgi:hypothetical protein
MSFHANATREQIIAALQAGHSIYRINKELRADRARIRTIRDEIGLATYARPELTIEDKWHQYARPVDGGHMEWTGEHSTTRGTPLLSYKERHYTAAAIAFRIRTGRTPEGQVFTDCGMKRCVAPAHVEDAPGRRRNREQLRYLRGGRALPESCGNGHKQAEHGRIAADGRAYCNACKRARDKAAREAVAS